MHRERLLLLANLLSGEVVAPRADRTFNLGAWALDSTEYLRPANLAASRGAPLPEGFCGTVCCAVGMACLDPRFNEQGLRLSRLDEQKDGDAPMPVFVQDGRKRVSWGAVEAFFEIDEATTLWLFRAADYPAIYDTPATAVIERLDLLLSGHTPTA